MHTKSYRNKSIPTGFTMSNPEVQFNQSGQSALSALSALSAMAAPFTPSTLVAAEQQVEGDVLKEMIQDLLDQHVREIQKKHSDEMEYIEQAHAYEMDVFMRKQSAMKKRLQEALDQRNQEIESLTYVNTMLRAQLDAVYGRTGAQLPNGS